VVDDIGYSSQIGHTRFHALDGARYLREHYDAARKALLRYQQGQEPATSSAGLAPKTVPNVHVMLHGALADALRWNLLIRNPATDARPPRARRQRHLVWNSEQLRQFVSHADEHGAQVAAVAILGPATPNWGDDVTTTVTIDRQTPLLRTPDVAEGP
jgi:hypothetical protein